MQKKIGSTRNYPELRLFDGSSRKGAAEYHSIQKGIRGTKASSDNETTQKSHLSIGPIMLVAGTCIGSGMIALPLVLAKLGLILSISLMALTWMLMYYTSLISLELHLQAGHGLSLGELGKFFSGNIASLIGVGSIKLLSYSLLSAFIYGGSSVLQKLLNTSLSQNTIATLYALVVMLILLFPIKCLDYVNRLLFIGVLAITAILVVGLVSMMKWSGLPAISPTYSDIVNWTVVIPIMFTSFGFQVIFHTLTNYCNKNRNVLKKVFLWGSFIPAVVYIIWTCSLLGVVYQKNPSFYELMIAGKVDVGELIKELTTIVKWHYVQTLIWWISLFAIVTSVLGVGIGLHESLRKMLAKAVQNTSLQSITASMITILPAYLVAVLTPNAFISALSFAGMVLVVIAILLPVYLLYKANATKLYYPALKRKWLIVLSTLAGIVIIVCEIGNLLG